VKNLLIILVVLFTVGCNDKDIEKYVNDLPSENVSENKMLTASIINAKYLTVDTGTHRIVAVKDPTEYFFYTLLNTNDTKDITLDENNRILVNSSGIYSVTYRAEIITASTNYFVRIMLNNTATPYGSLSYQDISWVETTMLKPKGSLLYGDISTTVSGYITSGANIKMYASLATGYDQDFIGVIGSDVLVTIKNVYITKLQ